MQLFSRSRFGRSRFDETEATLDAVSSEVISALSQIHSSVALVKDFVAGTASAVEEQSAVTRDISGNMQSAADAVSGVAENLSHINDAIKQSNTSMAVTKQAAESFAR